MKRTIRSLFVFLLATFLFLPAALAAGEMELTWEKHFTSMTPIFMNGHTGEQQWIAGFVARGDITYNGTKIGSVSSTIRMLNPPVSLTEKYDFLFISTVNNIDGMGTFTVNGVGITYSSNGASGEYLVSWHGSISNGTDSLAAINGLASGILAGNMFSGLGQGKEILMFKLGQ